MLAIWVLLCDHIWVWFAQAALTNAEIIPAADDRPWSPTWLSGARELQGSLTLELPASSPAQYCTSFMLLDPPEVMRTYSSIRNSSVPSDSQSTLFSDSAWVAHVNDTAGWLEIDLGSIVTVAGVVTQGSAAESAWVSLFEVNHSTDASTYIALGNFSSGQDGALVQAWFTHLTEMRYLRFEVLEFVNAAAMRAAAIVCEVPWVLRIGKSVSQSSTFAGASASRAWDGSFNPIFADGSCTETGSTTGPWWEVDLLDTYFVSGVMVTNPEAPYGIRLGPFTVLVDDQVCASDVAIDNATTLAVNCSTSTSAIQRQRADGTMEFGLFGTIVRIELTDRVEALTVCEVAVLGDKIFTLPNPTTVQLAETVGVEPAVCDPFTASWIASPCYNVSLDAGVVHDIFELATTNNTPLIPFWANTSFYPAGSQLKVVPPSLTQFDAWIGQCENAGTEGVMVAGGVNVSSVGFFINDTGLGSVASVAENLTFPMGGNYSLCVSDDGSFAFGAADMAHVDIIVNGVYDLSSSCYPDCLAQIEYNCYLRINEYNLAPGLSFGNHTSCVVDFAYDGAGYLGPVGNISWSAEIPEPTYGFHGDRQSLIEEPACGTEPATFICTDGQDCNSDIADRLLETDQALDFKRAYIPATSSEFSIYTARPMAVAACYCPGRNGCTKAEDFVQRVGVLYFYLARICRPGDIVCVNAFPGTIARFNFNVKVECPPGACSPDERNRVKLVQQDLANDRPSWDPQSGCRTAEELPLLDTNCYSAANCSLSGGIREDWKRFGENQGFEFRMGRSPYELRNNYMPMDVDVCYCNADCHHAWQWFKVGIFKLGPLRLVSAKTSTATHQQDWALEYAEQPGILGIHAPLENFGALGTREGGVLKLIQDEERLVHEDLQCASALFQTPAGLLLSGPSTRAEAEANYLGYRQITSDPVDQEYYIFNSRDPVDPISGAATFNRIEVSQATTLAICYCPFTNPDNSCESDSAWKLVSHILIRGPYGGLRWEVSTEVEFDLAFTGVGLSTFQTLRIINFGGSCTADNGNPNTGRFQLTGLRVKCPGACTDVGGVNDTENGDIRSVLHSGVLLNTSITDIMVVNSMETELVFEAPHGLFDGDVITLDEDFEIYCVAGSPCTWATLEVLKGVFSYADAHINYRAVDTPMGQTPDTYTVGNKVSRVIDEFRIRLAVGWPEPVPMFWLGESTIGWSRRNRATIAREVFGRTEQFDLRVCWGYATPYTARSVYVTEIGRINILEPPAMTVKPTLHMTTTAINRSAPVMLSFQTSGGSVGLQYGAARESLRLRLVFFNTDILDIRRANGEEVPDEHPDEHGRIEDATQARCGDLLLELWSNHADCGFPMPKGCYVRSYGYMQRREVHILFEKQNALRNATTYTMVFNAQVRSTDARLEGQYMYVDIMDEVDTVRRYKVIERGQVLLMATPREAAKDPNDGGELDAQFRPGPEGFRLLGGENGLLELRRTTSNMVVEMRGPVNESGKIKRESILTFFFMPLTQWHTAETCTTECINTDHFCGPVTNLCAVQSVMGAGQNRNALRLQLPGNFQDLYGNTSIQLDLGGLTMPPGGFFASRIAAQVTRRDGRAPYFAMSGGTFIWKSPDSGLSFARLISAEGSGNSRPFAGDTQNILYVQVLLPMTILAGHQLPDASFTITLPVGYTCVMPETEDMDDDDDDDEPTNPWEAEQTLPVFAGQEAQCRGTPVAARSATYGWTVNANRCTFTPDHPHGVVYQGSSMYVRITADNPPYALPWTDPANTWTVQMTGRGQAGVVQATQEYPFILDDGEYSNTGVLGLLGGVSCQPSSFEPLVWQELSCFFAPDQEVQAGGYLQMLAPPDFDLGFEDLGEDIFGRDLGFGCRVRDLLDSYYATGDNPSQATLRLPDVASCSVLRGFPRNATIQLEQTLQAGRSYAFGIRVRNPAAYHPAQLSGWKLFTVDPGRNFLDGTRDSIPFLPSSGNNDSWALYPPSAFTASINISDTRPFALTGERAAVTVVMSNVNVPGLDLFGGIRLVAPQGYQWTFAPDEFLYRPALDPAQTTTTTAAAGDDAIDPMAHRLPATVGATADFPFGLPRWDGGAALVFEHPARTTTTSTPFDDDFEDNSTDDEDDMEELNSTVGEFLPNEVYAFVAYLTIPSQKPTLGSDVMFLDVGYADDDPGQRIGIVAYPLPPLKALSMAEVDYTTNVQGMDNIVHVRIATATHIADGGGLIITAPVGFFLQDPCVLMPSDHTRLAEDYPLQLPPVAQCRAAVRRDGRLSLRLYPGPDGLPPAAYGFAVQVTNPSNPTANSLDEASPCGTRYCWQFESVVTLQAVADSTLPLEPSGDLTYLDVTAYARSFDINTLMSEAYILPISLELRVLTFRNDRRGVANNVVFAFRLRERAVSGASLVFRGPEGVQFSVNCLEGVEVHRDHVLGAWENFPAGFSQWPGLVKVRSCLGGRTDAQVGLVFLDNAELSAGSNYLIRMPLRYNPLVTPEPNMWTMELARDGAPGETSTPFQSFMLSTFSDAAVVPSTAAAGPLLSSQVRPRNPVRVEFRVFNEVPPGGRMLLTMPSGYEVDAFIGGGCLATLEELDGNRFQWPEEDISCQVSSSNQELVTLTLSSGSSQAMLAHQLHRVVIVVFNPSLEEAGVDTRWHLETTLPTGYPLDEGHLLGFELNSEMLLWAYEPWSSPSVSLTHGAALIENLVFSMRFPDALALDDQVHVHAPPAFQLEGANQGECNSFAWIVPDSMQASSVACNLWTMVIHITSTASLPAGDLAQFSITLQNPTLRIPAIENVWICTHFSAAMEARSSKAFDSWPIEQQLTHLAFNLLGPALASSAFSSVEVQFQPVAPAESVDIMAIEPMGFDFGMTTVRSGTGLATASIIEAVGHVLRLSMSLQPLQLVHLQLDNVQLGATGGQTSLSVVTWIGGMWEFGVWNPGTKQDEKLHFTGGYRLPARISLVHQLLYTDIFSQPDLFPVQTTFHPHMGTSAFADFDMVVAGATSANDLLHIQGQPFNFTTDSFDLTVSAEDAVSIGLASSPEQCPITMGQARRCSVPSDVTVLGRSLEVLLQLPMIQNIPYRLTASVLTPAPSVVLALMEPPRWSFVISDDGPLPKATNDHISGNFSLAEAYSLNVTPVQPRAPPGTVIQVDLGLEPGLQAPTEVRLILPMNFTVPGSCFVDGGGLILSCVRDEPTPTGREVASLRTVRAGVTMRPPSLRILIRTPDHEWFPDDSEAGHWLVEGVDFDTRQQLGWGKVMGFSVNAMTNVTLVYPGAAEVEGTMVWSFNVALTAVNGSRLQLTMPLGVAARCDAGSFQPVHLSGVSQCEHTVGSQIVTIPLHEDLPSGTYVFALPITPPSRTPFANVFAIEVIDADGFVQEAFRDIPGASVQQLPLQALPLFWTSSTPGTSSNVTVGFRIADLITLEQQASGGVSGLSELVIEMPPGFAHQVAGSEDIAVPADLPLRGQSANSWLDASSQGQMRLHLSPPAVLGVGFYEIRFPVMVPTELPTYNIWQVYFCGQGGNNCNSPTDADVLLNLPVVGFAAMEAAPPRGGLEPISTTTLGPGEEAAPREANVTGSMEMQVNVPEALTLCSLEFLNLMRESLAASLAAVTNDRSYLPEEVKEVAIDSCPLRRLQEAAGSILVHYMVTALNATAAETLVTALTDSSDTFTDVLEYDLWNRGNVMVYNVAVQTPTVALPPTSTSSTTTTVSGATTGQSTSASSTSTSFLASNSTGGSTTPVASTAPGSTSNPYENVDFLDLFLGRTPGSGGNDGGDPMLFPATNAGRRARSSFWLPMAITMAFSSVCWPLAF